jgi:hypothetical protein
MISGSAAKSTSDTTTGSLSYISDLISGASQQGLYNIIVNQKHLNDSMVLELRTVYGYKVTEKNDFMGTNVEYVVSWEPNPSPTPTPSVTPTRTPTPTPTRTPTNTPTPTKTTTPSVTPTRTPTPSVTGTGTPTPTPTGTNTPTPTSTSITPTPTGTPTPTPTMTPTGTSTPVTPTPTPSAASLYQSYNYSISATDLAAATGNTGGLSGYNNKVVVVITNGYNCGNITERNFTYSFSAVGSSYISWLISRKTNVPVIGYYQNNTLVTTGLISTQTINPSVPC